jgi:hypothetical protein
MKIPANFASISAADLMLLPIKGNYSTKDIEIKSWDVISFTES